MHYWSKSLYTFWAVVHRLTLILEICTKIFMVPSKMNQCFLHPNQKHLLGLLSNYPVEENIDKHTCDGREYLLKFRGLTSCILIDKIMNLLMTSRISWLNLCSFLHKFAKVWREDTSRQNDEPFDEGCYQPGGGQILPSYIHVHILCYELHMCFVVVGADLGLFFFLSFLV